MKNLILLALLIGMMGCASQSSSDQMFRDTTVDDPMIVTIDNCEYIQYRVREHDAITHKGNCKNPIHIHNGGSHE